MTPDREISKSIGYSALVEERSIIAVYHETDTLSVVIFLSAVEETGDLLSSTYIGSKIGTIGDTLKSYGENAYLPVNYDPLNNKVLYGSYPNIWIILRDEGTSEVLIASDFLAFNYPVQLRKVVGTQ